MTWDDSRPCTAITLSLNQQLDLLLVAQYLCCIVSQPIQRCAQMQQDFLICRYGSAAYVACKRR